MVINSTTKISAILDAHPKSIESIISINRHFTKLSNPVLRKVLAPRVTIAMAAQVGGCSVNDFFDALRPLGFEIENNNNTEQMNITNQKTESLPEGNSDSRAEKVVYLDVRPILESGVDPFKAIMETLDQLTEEESLCIINTFEPIPLLNILNKKGYKHQTTRLVNGEVHTLIFKGLNSVTTEVEIVNSGEIKSFEEAQQYFDGNMEFIDVRELEMPMPLVSILEAIEKLEPAQALFVHHKRLPQYLLPELEQRGYSLQSLEHDESNTKLIIYKNR